MQWSGASHFEFDRKSVETETTTWSEFSNAEEAIVEQVPTEEINKSKRARIKIRDQDSQSQGSE